MRRWRVVAVAAVAGVALAALGGGCGVPSQDEPHVIERAALPPEPSTTQPDAPAIVDALVYFVLQDRPVPVVRRAAGPGLGDVLDALVSGPTDGEVARGLRSTLPAGVSVHVVDTSDRGVATIEVGSLLEGITGQEQILVFAQLVLTATAVPGVDGVVFVRDGERIDAPTVDGTLVARPVTAADYEPLLRAPTPFGT